MKFGKQMRLLIKPEWSEHYVRYKLYKSVLKFKDDDLSSIASEESLGNPPSLENITHKVARSSISCGASPLAFSASSEAIVHVPSSINGDSLMHMSPFLPRSRSENVAVLLKEDLKKVSGHTQNVLRQLEERFDEMRVDVSLACAKDPKVVAFCQDLEELKQFITLNHTAILKVLKKAEKKTETPLGSPQSSLRRSGMSRELFRKAMMEAMNEAPESAYFELGADAERTLAQLAHQLEELSGKVAKFLAKMQNVEDEQARRVSFTLPVVKPTEHMVTKLDLNSFPPGQVTCVKLAMSESALGGHVFIPVMVARGVVPGHVTGITAALHGNELNGIPLIHTLFRYLDCSQLVGTIVAIPVCNPHGYVRYQRGFSDGQDLNRIMPGKQNGNASQVYAYNFCKKIISKLDYLIDLHTASFGRLNSYYVRADMNSAMTRHMAVLANPQIIVHNTGPDGSLRGAAADMGIGAITLEIGDPQAFHSTYVKKALGGVVNILSYLKAIPDNSDLHEQCGKEKHDKEPISEQPVVCSRSFWIYSKSGGVLYVLPKVAEWVRRGDVIAEITDVYGRPLHKHLSPETGIVVGKSCNPVCQTGDRILHLGIVTESFPAHQDDGHV